VGDLETLKAIATFSFFSNKSSTESINSAPSV
jgi:hypothetical protein